MHTFGISSWLLCELDHIPCDEEGLKWKRQKIDSKTKRTQKVMTTGVKLNVFGKSSEIS